MKKIYLIILVFHLSFIICNAQWHFQNSGVTSILRDIEFINKNTGWICGENGVILKTTNGGINWIQQNNEATGKSLYGIYPVNANTVFCVGYFETILKTTNGGNNWITIQNGVIGLGNCYLSVFFINEMTGWIGAWASPDKVMKTTNGGLNWFDYFDWGRFRDLYFKDSLYGIGVNEASYYAITSNGGINWYPYAVGNGDYYDISIIPYNNNIGFIVSGIGYSVRKTTNFGQIFDSVGNIPFVVPPYEIYCSKFINENIGWAGGSYGVLYKTGDGGKTWHSQNSLSQAFVRRMYALNDTVAWAVGGGGKIIHTTNGGDTVNAVRQISSSVPDKIELFQNYPNPFNSITNVKFQMLKRGFAEIKVFDLTGKLIKNLLKENLNTGEYEIKFEAGNLGSGVYFYSLFINGELINTKKAILIK